MSEFFNFLFWVLMVIFIFGLVLGFNKQMMEKNRIRDEAMKKREGKIKNNGEKDEITD